MPLTRAVRRGLWQWAAVSRGSGEAAEVGEHTQPSWAAPAAHPAAPP